MPASAGAPSVPVTNNGYPESPRARQASRSSRITTPWARRGSSGTEGPDALDGAAAPGDPLQQRLHRIDARVLAHHRHQAELARGGDRLEVTPAEVERTGTFSSHQSEVNQQKGDTDAGAFTVGPVLHRADGATIARCRPMA